MGGSDCERLLEGWLAQPSNAWSSLAFVLSGGYVLTRPSRSSRGSRRFHVVGAGALVFTGVGSFAFHGPQPSWADEAHDISIAVLLAVLLGGGARGSAALVGATAAVLLTVPSSDLLVHGALAVALGVVQLRAASRGQGPPHLAVAALATGVVLLVLGRSGGLLCEPGSPLQAHAGWHILSSAAAGAVLVGERRTGAGASRGDEAV